MDEFKKRLRNAYRSGEAERWDEPAGQVQPLPDGPGDYRQIASAALSAQIQTPLGFAQEVAGELGLVLAEEHLQYNPTQLCAHVNYSLATSVSAARREAGILAQMDVTLASACDLVGLNIWRALRTGDGQEDFARAKQFPAVSTADIERSFEQLFAAAYRRERPEGIIGVFGHTV
jgi:hypothetical protein